MKRCERGRSRLHSRNFAEHMREAQTKDDFDANFREMRPQPLHVSIIKPFIVKFHYHDH
jgi:hypothetical protein